MATFSELSASNKQMSAEEKKKSLNSAIKSIEKKFGKGSIGTLTNEFKEFPHIPSDILSLDLALGIGGLPKGRIVEFYGTESSGKSTAALIFAAKAQKLGGIAAIVDAEHAFDPSWAEKLGINCEELLVNQPDNAEQALEIVDELIKSNAVDLIIVDSTSALTPRAEIEGDMGQAQMGLQARLMSQAMRKITASVSRSKTIIIFISQVRDKIGCIAPETMIEWCKK